MSERVTLHPPHVRKALGQLDCGCVDECVGHQYTGGYKQPLRDKLAFFRPHDNWHKIPGLRTVLCWIGRHDFEPVGVKAIPRGVEVELQCFYCEKRRRSSWRGYQTLERDD